MKFSFPKIEHVKQPDIDLPPVSIDDIEWAKSICSKKLRTKDDYLNEMKTQFLTGEARRCLWLLRAKVRTGFGLLGPEYESVLENALLSDVLNRLLNIDNALINSCNLPRRMFQFLAYAEVQDTGDIYNTVCLAAGLDEEDLLDMFRTSLTHLLNAIEEHDIKTLAKLLDKRYKTHNGKTTAKHGLEKEELEKELRRLYFNAARVGNVSVLAVLHERAPFSECYENTFQVSLTHQRYDAVCWFIKRGVDQHKVLEECEERGIGDVVEVYINKNKQNEHDNLYNRLKAVKQEFQAAEKKTDKKEIKADEPKLDIKWDKEDNTTITRIHRTRTLTHEMIFFFEEGQVIQNINNRIRDKQINGHMWSFDDFPNPVLLKEAAEKLKELGGEPDLQNHQYHKPAVKRLDSPNLHRRNDVTPAPQHG